VCAKVSAKLKEKAHLTNFEIDESRPIIDMCFVIVDREVKIPTGYEVVTGFVEKWGKNKYALCFLRLPKDEKAAEAIESSPVVGFQVIRQGESLPFGYELITTTLDGNEVDFGEYPYRFCYTKIGTGIIKNVRFLSGINVKSITVPAGYVVMKNSPYESSINLSSNEGIESYFAVLKDYHLYIIPPDVKSKR